MKYHELVTECNRVCNGVDKSSNQITKQICMNYIRLLIRRYFKGGDNRNYCFKNLILKKIIDKYRKLLWDR